MYLILSCSGKKRVVDQFIFPPVLSYDGSLDKYYIYIYIYINLINISLASKALDLEMIMFGWDTSFCYYKEPHFQILSEELDIYLRKKPQN